MAIETSEAYRSAIKADVEVSTIAAEFGFIPDGSREGSAVTSNNQHPLSRTYQMNDGNYDMLKYVTGEYGRWKLDGTYTLIDTSTTTQQIGWLSDATCDSEGNFATPPSFLYTMDKAYDVIGVTLYFDVIEWASRLTIKYYGSSGALLASKVFENDDQIMVIEFPCAGVKEIVSEINSWNTPGRMAKCCEALPGEIFVFDPNNTFSFELRETINPFSTTVEMPQFIISFDNSQKKFDIVNPSGLMAYLRKMMMVNSRLGILTSVFEYISTGDFYVHSWPDTPQEDSAQLVCMPEFAFHSNTVYVAPGTGVQTVAAAAAVIFGIAGITNYVIDSTVANISVNQYIGENVPLINALGQLAVAAGGYWKFERDGSYRLLPFVMPAASNTQTYDDIFEKPTIEQKPKITSVNVKVYGFDIDGNFIEIDNLVRAGVDDGAQAEDICSCFVNSSARSNAVGQLALQYYAMRLSHELEYRGDPSIQSGDVISVENDYGSSNVFVLNHVITWNRETKLSGTFRGVSNA